MASMPTRSPCEPSCPLQLVCWLVLLWSVAAGHMWACCPGGCMRCSLGYHASAAGMHVPPTARHTKAFPPCKSPCLVSGTCCEILMFFGV